MSAAKNREMFESTRGDVPLDVMNVAGSAGDNAADVVGFGKRFDENGNFTDEFIGAWMGGVEGLLCCDDSATDEAREWFASHGFKW